jgi:hypothetical protein
MGLISNNAKQKWIKNKFHNNLNTLKHSVKKQKEERNKGKIYKKKREKTIKKKINSRYQKR